jgi:hypothetical protein
VGLRAAYDRAASLIGPDRAESFEVALEVERLRLAQRPRDVRVVLLAESHVWTSPEETASRVRQPDGVVTGFARFVYCLGCGEPSRAAIGLTKPGHLAILEIVSYAVQISRSAQ